jgi:uncharacterized damage-inducible protein DinB
VIQRSDPDSQAESERAALEQWLDFHRATLALKVAGLTDEQARARVTPSATTLLGLVRHLADGERWWFREVLAGDAVAPLYWRADQADADFEDLGGQSLAEAVAIWEHEVAAARASAAGFAELTTIRQGTEARAVDLRWIYLHMIEEYARHNGHADVIRELIDGTTGV